MNRFFSPGTILNKELRLYNELYKTTLTEGLTPKLVEKIIFSVKVENARLNHELLEEEKTKVINLMNRAFGKEIWNSHVENYKTYAQIYGMLLAEDKINRVERVMLEEDFIQTALNAQPVEVPVTYSEKNIYESAVSLFNNEYSSKLLKEQHDVLRTYIASPEDNGAQYNFVVHEELTRIKKLVEEKLDGADIETSINLKEALVEINSFKVKPLEGEEDLIRVLKLQELAKIIGS
jgi:hypothetical protein